MEFSTGIGRASLVSLIVFAAAVLLGVWQTIRPITEKLIATWADRNGVIRNDDVDDAIRAHFRQNRKHRLAAIVVLLCAVPFFDYKELTAPLALVAGYLVGSVTAEIVRGRSKKASVPSLTQRRLTTYAPKWALILAVVVALSSFSLIALAGPKNIRAMLCIETLPEFNNALSKYSTSSAASLDYRLAILSVAGILGALAIALLGAGVAVRRRSSAATNETATVEDAFRSTSVRSCIASGLACALVILGMQLGFASDAYLNDCAPTVIDPGLLTITGLLTLASFALVSGATVVWYAITFSSSKRMRAR